MARAATAPELAAFRLEGQPSRLYLAIYKPSSVYTARVNQSTFTDPIAQITYDGGSGTLADVKIGMTMFVGSSAGAYDKGVARIRSTPSATVFYIGLTSEINFADNDYITIVDDIELWHKPAVQFGDETYIDYNVAYSDQHGDMAPVPVMGPEAVVKLTGETVDHQRDASDSWVLGSTISGYSWVATGPASVTIDDDTAADPTFTFDTAGWYRIALTITAANSKTATGYRWTYVYSAANPPTTDFTLEYCRGDSERGGCQFDIILLDNAALTDFYERALVILFAEDRYGSSTDSIGPLAGYENVIAVGRIDQETVEWYPDYSRVLFEVHGTTGWLSKLASHPITLRNATAAPTAWEEVQGLTVDKAIWHALHWRSNATQRVDVYKSGDARYAEELTAEAGTLYDQLSQLAEVRILARPLSDRYGRLFIQVDTQYLASADRAAIPTVMTLTSVDWSYIEIERQPAKRVSMIELSAEYSDGTDSEIILSKASGIIITRYGSHETIDRVLVASQSAANVLSGNILAHRNNPYPQIDLEMPSNMRLVDICPLQYLVMNIAVGDTERGIVWSSQKVIPRAWELEWDSKTGCLTTILELEAETLGFPGQTVPYIPPVDPGILPWDLEDLPLPHIGPLPNPWQPPVIPPDPVIPPIEGEDCPTDAPANGPYPLYLTGSYSSGSFGSPGTYKRATSIACVLRGSGHDNPTYYEIKGVFQKKVSGEWVDTTDDAWYAIKAYNGSELVATGTHDAVTGNGRTRTGKFNYDGPITHITMEHTDVLHPGSVSARMYQGVGSYYALNDGTLQWGFYGGGVFAIYQTTATSGEQHGADIAATITIPLYSGRTLTVTQAARVSQTGSSPSIQWLQGGYLESKTAWSIVWNESPYVSDALVSESYELTGAQNDIGIEIRVGEYSGGVVYTFSNQIYVFVNELYRLTVTSANIYNICEVGT